MSDYTLYNGLPQVVWSGLCQKTEELFYEEEIGQIILGVYPFGERIFGLEQKDPEILCLYVDSYEEILNPLKNINKVVKQPLLDSVSYVHFIDLWDWVSGLSSYIKLHHLVPCLYDNLYEEPLLEKILIPIRKFLIKELPTYRATTPLEARALLILKLTGKFLPNINPDWGEIKELDSIINSKEVLELDEYIRESYLINDHLNQQDLNAYGNFIKEKLNLNQQNTKNTQSLVKIGQKTSEFYRKII